MDLNNFLIVSRNSYSALPYIKEATDYLSKRGKNLFCLAEKQKFFSGIEDIKPLKENEMFIANVAIVFGGDGTILKTAKLLLEYGTPILGINMGTVGYLAEAEPLETISCIQKILEGDYKTEARSTLSISSGDKAYIAINEAVVHRCKLGHILNLDISINGNDIISLRADGVIVSTPTGSTAYNLSAGGPILEPLSKTFVLTPICAHSLMARPIVMDGNSDVTIKTYDFRSQTDTPSLEIDGKTVNSLTDNGLVKVKLSEKKIYLLRTSNLDFYKTLQAKLGTAEARNV